MSLTRREFTAVAFSPMLGLTGCNNNKNEKHAKRPQRKKDDKDSDEIKNDEQDSRFKIESFNNSVFAVPSKWKELAKNDTSVSYINNPHEAGLFFLNSDSLDSDYFDSDEGVESWLDYYANALPSVYNGSDDTEKYVLTNDGETEINNDVAKCYHTISVYKDNQEVAKGNSYVLINHNWMIHGFIKCDNEYYEDQSIDFSALVEEIDFENS